MTGPIPLFDLPHGEARAAVATGAPVYLPVNPVEFHGPHLPLRNDALISEGLLRDLHARLRPNHPDWPLLLASPIELGSEPTAGVGTRHTRPAALSSVVREACRALAELGARRVVIMTFHGAPLHAWALEAGVELLEARGVQAFQPLNLVTEQMLGARDLSHFAPAFAHVEDEAERTDMLRDLAHDFHAGFFETSLSLHYCPKSVSPLHRQLAPCAEVVPDAALSRASRAVRALGKARLADELELAAAGLGWSRVKPRAGYTGRPHRATAAAGAIFAREIVALYAERAEAIFAGRARSPRPILGWLRAASLGGRIGSTSGIAVVP